ncbi:hypothetical protein [Conchiformibius kuhniae]|uniref:Lipoprotein n=1 Tax=Conchiformibius kuhniae TaxID=211502 RepID=A0A8T9MUK9_9NEIS|nr:hypothetical protein [Conchiformibius kuhniae]UOP04038.1 hypothetical protein LVJ77_05975 [Conchiformibius kuhniae]
MAWKIGFLGVAVLLAGCAADGSGGQSDGCAAYEKQAAQCREYNSRYHGLDYERKMAACLKARGFPHRKKQYCGK